MDCWQICWFTNVTLIGSNIPSTYQPFSHSNLTFRDIHSHIHIDIHGGGAPRGAGRLSLLQMVFFLSGIFAGGGGISPTRPFIFHFFPDIFPLVMTNIAMENDHAIYGKLTINGNFQ